MWRPAFSGPLSFLALWMLPIFPIHPPARQPARPHPNAIQPFDRTKENSHATWNLSRLLAEIRIPSTLNDSIMHAQNRSCVGGKADADQDPSRVLCAAGPNPGHPSSPELSFTPCRLRGGWEVKPSQRRSWQSVAVGPTGTALCKPTN